MSPAEFLELLQITSDGTGGHATNAVSTMTAYLIAAYFIGSKLNRIQFISVTIVYFVYIVFPIRAAIRGFDRMGTLTTEFQREHAEIAAIYLKEAFFSFEFYRILFLLIFASAWALSLSFMYFARKSKDSTPSVT
jgi:hypothetical protein